MNQSISYEETTFDYRGDPVDTTYTLSRDEDHADYFVTIRIDGKMVLDFRMRSPMYGLLSPYVKEILDSLYDFLETRPTPETRP